VGSDRDDGSPRWQGILKQIRSTFPAARNAPDEDIVVKAIFSGEPGRLVELSKEVWETAFPRVIDVTIFIVESMNSME